MLSAYHPATQLLSRHANSFTVSFVRVPRAGMGRRRKNLSGVDKHNRRLHEEKKQKVVRRSVVANREHTQCNACIALRAAAVPIIISLLKVTKLSKILWIGAGDGDEILGLATLNKILDITAVDIDQNVLGIFARRLLKAGAVYGAGVYTLGYLRVRIVCFDVLSDVPAVQARVHALASEATHVYTFALQAGPEMADTALRLAHTHSLHLLMPCDMWRKTRIHAKLMPRAHATAVYTRGGTQFRFAPMQLPWPHTYTVGQRCKVRAPSDPLYSKAWYGAEVTAVHESGRVSVLCDDGDLGDVWPWHVCSA